MHTTWHNYKMHNRLPQHDNGEIQNVPHIPQIGSTVQHKPERYDLQHTFHGKDDNKDVLDFFLWSGTKNKSFEDGRMPSIITIDS